MILPQNLYSEKFKMGKKIFSIILGIVFLINLGFVSATLTIDSVDVNNLYPGEQERLRIEVKNDFNYDVEDISLKLDFESLPLSSVGSSEESVDEIDEDDSEDFTFIVRASTDITPGDYDIPYKITYKDADEEETEKTGTIGIRVSAKTELDFSVEAENAIIGQNGKINLKIINKGFGEIKFVSIVVSPSGFNLISNKDVYVGTVDSDDFEIASFDVFFKSKNAQLNAEIEYKDFENKKKTSSISLPIKVYSVEEALEIGLIKKNKAGIYIYIVIFLIIIWFIWRIIKKRKKNKKR